MSKRILLADDSLTIQKVVELTFLDEDFEVDAVGSGDEAISRLDADLPDIVIADVHMPGASGYEVCRRAKDRRSDLPVLLLVGTFEALDEDELVACGADGNLKKPFDSQELLQVVQSMTSGQRPTEAEVVEDVPAVEGLETTLHEEEAVEPPPLPVTGFDMGGSFAEAEADDAAAGSPSAGFGFGDEELEGEPELEPVDLDLGYGDGGEAAEIDTGDDTGPASDNETVLIDAQAMAEVERPTEDWAPEAEVEEESAAEGAESEETRDAEPTVEESAEPAPEPAREAPVEEAAAAPIDAAPVALSEADVDRVARRVVELMGDDTVREVAWDVIPDLAEIVIKDRIRELEAEAD